MQISSSNGSQYYGQLGLQRSQDSLHQASSKVAAAAQRTPGAESVGQNDSDIQEGLVEANHSKLNAQANTKVIAAADDMLGTLIDITV